ncbi:permease [Microbulbifer mangrovi]|uniref:permease n=1 Tax=Microbulbifer mangrovi TaxID=927787 RepID=UPI00195C8A99|nr:permease [Microbulbifer mangrovi]
MQTFLSQWHQSALTTLGLFWMAFWAFALGYLISSMVQVFVTRRRMRENLGKAGVRSVGLASFFGFISSSCSFAALATTRALFAKGASLIPSLAFLLASTNLVIELGIVIAIFLGWQFVVAEYLGGILLILLMWGLVAVSLPERLEKQAREHAREAEDADERSEESTDWEKLFSRHFLSEPVKPTRRSGRY